jgi:hypothetical protein
MAAIDNQALHNVSPWACHSIPPPATFHPPTCAASLVKRCALCSSVLSKQINFLVYCEPQGGYLCAIGRHEAAK